jgi:hypothetical protein
MRKIRIWVGLIPVLLCYAGMATQQATAGESDPPSTISVYQSLTADALEETLANLHAPESLKVVVDVQPGGSYWYVESALMRALRQRGLQPVPAGGSWVITCAVSDAHVRYANVRRDGLLGTRTVDRTVTLALWLRISDREKAEYVADREWRVERTDTIEVSDVRQVEHPDVAATHGVVPSEGFFSSWLEPFIMVGAVGVAIFLLFTTRS